ncbi:glycosyltransferase family 1 protein [Cellulosimicrobium sp. Marseille-Q4280]|uniref:glycosyltransferase family 4 protein n=1 Tax=Cellulosimicrobium sp. Marseille-Q4280 TaxID=2937992 RepID=UPI002040CD93|nr:glycosyltransferase family 1 protein [Cellulosimicrobium sp. Marseille-Q4280]
MTSPATGAARYLDALDRRLASAAEIVLGTEGSPVDGPPGTTAAQLLPLLVAAARLDEAGDDVRWLVLVAVFARYPTSDEFVAFRRSLELDAPESVEADLLATAMRNPARHADGPMVIVRSVVVEVNYSARHDHHTGIQRVVRETVPRWADHHEVTITAWGDDNAALRTLAPRERARVLSFGQDTPLLESETDYVHTVVVPWHTRVLLPDVPVGAASDVLATLARWSGSTVGLVGYDLIPITSADLRPWGEANGTAGLLHVVKHADRVACISRSASAEFRGFVEALPAQGLVGPHVDEVQLPAISSPMPGSGLARPASVRPVVLCTGTREPHKNHRAVVHAAERLWREGVDFELRLVGGFGWSDDPLGDATARLRAEGRPLVELGRVSEQVLWDELRAADAVAFVSLHEGYGLPIAEALSVGTPVLTTAYGSQAEVAADGGCVLVDPRDDDQVTEGLRRLVTDGDLRERLKDEARNRPERTWDDYAADLWDFLTGAEPPKGEH